MAGPLPPRMQQMPSATSDDLLKDTRWEPGKAGAEAMEWALDKTFDLMVDVLKDNRLASDFETLRPQIESAMPAFGGVALRLSIGMKPAHDGRSIPEYLGLQILGAADSKYDAVAQYGAREPEQTSSIITKPCSINDPSPGPSMKANDSGASTPGLSRNLGRYVEMNPRNVEGGDGGLVIMTYGYVRTEIVFVGRNFLKSRRRLN